MKVGYARTSTADQKAGLDAQVRDLKAAGCEELFIEQASSVGERPEFDRALQFVRRGDTLVVTRVDRLVRSMGKLCEVVELLTAKGAHLQVLGTDINTSTGTGKLLLNLLASFAAFERDIMLERQREGIAKAQADKRYRGRAPLASDKVAAIKAMLADGVRPTDIARKVGVGRTSVYKVIEQSEAA